MMSLEDSDREVEKARITDRTVWVAGGMTLRDWFAGQALAGLEPDTAIDGYVAIADYCYRQADALMKRRDVWSDS